MEYTNVCFVIMPFGNKPVGNRQVNFDFIYDNVFRPAIEATNLPEGGGLIARRTDKDFFTGNISTEMFQYIEYSRFAVADISGLNPNVFYELGTRHRARETGTAIFRQADAPIPFDINQIKAFPYEYEPEDKVKLSRELIMRVLSESLQYNKLDSPVQAALKTQKNFQQHIEGLLREAEDAIRNQDRMTAIGKYRQAVEAEQNNPVLRMRLGLLLKEEGQWKEALSDFIAAIQSQPNYAEAWRERGIAENKLCCKQPLSSLTTGKESLQQAVKLNPQDFDALASLGGIFKRQRKFVDALAMYHRSTEVSNGHPYPLLNEVKLRAHVNGKLELDSTCHFQLTRAERALRAQVKNDPPYNAPWSCFDLAEVRLYLDNPEEFLKFIDQGLQYCSHSWQAQTFRDSLNLLVEANIRIEGLDTGLSRLTDAIKSLPA